MTIKELLRAHRITSVSARKAKSVKSREIDFDLITVIARQIRRLRKQGDANAPGQSPGNREAEGLKR